MRWRPSYVHAPRTADTVLLASRDELKAHLDSETDVPGGVGDWSDAVLDSKLDAASAYLEGPDGLTGVCYSPRTISLRYYGPVITDRMLLIGGQPHLGVDFTATHFAKDGSISQELSRPFLSVSNGRWFAVLDPRPV